jgi:uncharacterized protein YndB with AHSA1/START domain
MDLVVIDYEFDDETAWTDPEVMPRWFAEYRLWQLGVYDRQPVPGKRVKTALLIPREERLH